MGMGETSRPEMYMEATSGTSLDRRSVIGGMAGAFGRALIAMGRAQ